MAEFWRDSGFGLLERDAAGRLRVTDDFLRAYLLRPEIRPVPESCAAERALHESLMREPRRGVRDAEVAAIADPDARDNYRVLLRFRERLLRAATLEACYAGLFGGGGVDVPPLFVAQLAQVILRNVLGEDADPLEARAAELFFREHKAAVRDGHVLLADLETVERHASGARYGSVGRLVVEARGSLARLDLDVVDRSNAALYWARESRRDTVIRLGPKQPGTEALARVVAAWIAHFLAVEVAVRPLRAIEERRWAWHVGLDAESTAILNELWRGGEVAPERMRRILALFRVDFADPGAMRADVAGRPVYLALCANDRDEVRMKPQNLLLNLPLAARS